jgi:outer membrane protein OmpA-like peptidoglycan-associated protein
MQRRAFLTAFATALAVPAFSGFAAAQETPSSEIILRRLDAAPARRLREEERVTVRELKRRPDLRSAAPSINIQSINFAFGSADIPRSEYRKVRQIARAMEQLLNRRRRAVFLIEGHTDAVGSAASNQILSERRAESLKRLLVQEFGIPSRALETVGYGEDYLLVQTLSEEWRNRRVTLRRIDEFVR